MTGLGFEFADVDEDEHLDIVTMRSQRLHVLRSRPEGRFESRDLGISTAAPGVLDFVVDPGEGQSKAVVYVLSQSSCVP